MGNPFVFGEMKIGELGGIKLEIHKYMYVWYLVCVFVVER